MLANTVLYKDFNSANLLDNFIKRNFPENRVGQIPVDIIEQEDSYELRMAIPGFDEDQLEIQLDQNELRISASQKEESTDEKGTYLRREISTRDIERVFVLPQHIDREKVEASVDKGILSVTLFKAESFKPRKIQVKASS